MILRIQYLLTPLFLLFTVQFCHAQNNIFDAARSGDLETIKVLHKKDAKLIESKDDKGYTPLVLASYYGHKDVVLYLVEHTDDLETNTSYGSPLMGAVVKGYSDIVRIFLEHKVDPNSTDQQGSTAAHYAVLFKNYDIIKQLVDANADFNIKNNVGKSAMDYAKSLNDSTINNFLNLKK